MVLLNKENLKALLRQKYPEKCAAEIEDIANCITNRVEDLYRLLSPENFRILKETVGHVEDWIEKLKGVMETKEKAHTLGVVGGGLGVLGAITCATPIGPLLLFTAAATGFVSGIMSNDMSKEKENIVKRIQRTLQREAENFRSIARLVRRLDETFRSKLGISFYSDADKRFLDSAIQSVLRGKGAYAQRFSWEYLLRNLALAESMALALDTLGLVTSCIASSLPFINLALQIFLFAEEVDSNKATLSSLNDGLSRLRRECEILNIWY